MNLKVTSYHEVKLVHGNKSVRDMLFTVYGKFNVCDDVLLYYYTLHCAE